MGTSVFQSSPIPDSTILHFKLKLRWQKKNQNQPNRQTTNMQRLASNNCKLGIATMVASASMAAIFGLNKLKQSQSQPPQLEQRVGGWNQLMTAKAEGKTRKVAVELCLCFFA